MQDLSLYIHIPFCKTICLYCNFLTFAHKNRWIPEYIDALKREITLRSEQYKDHEVETIFFGGGTPSLIEPTLIKEVIQKINENFRTKNCVEISIECNPESVDPKRLETYQSCGITRFSLGVQSLNPKTLMRIARPHDSKTIFQALEHFKQSGIQNFGTDFIMGLPGQTLQSFQDEVETVLTYKPAHMSFYFLSYDTKKIDLFIQECPAEEEQIRMYHWVCQKMNQAGFLHYEVSNWAKPGFESKHNQRYWEQKDYLGLGLGAHSIVKNTMWENQKNFDDYLNNPLKIENETPLDNETKAMESIMLGLRTQKGINMKDYENRYGKTNELLGKAAPYLETKKLVFNNHSLHPTEEGFLIIDKITHDLL